MENQKHNLDSDSISKLLITFTIPTFLAMLAQTLYSIIDIIFIGRFVGPLGIAGLTIVLPIQLFTVGIGLMTGMGGASLISRLLGGGDLKKAEQALGNAILLAIIAAAILTITGLTDVSFWCRLLGASQTILPYSRDYLEIILIGMLFSCSGFAFSYLIRSGGNPTIPMIGQIMGAVLNIILDAVFIIYLDMGVKGAALATVIAQVISLVFYLLYYLTGKPPVALRAGTLKPDWISIKSILAIGISSLIMMLANSLCSVVVNRTIVSYGGDMAMSAYGIINQISMFAILPAIVLGQGLQPIIGFNYGAKRYDRVIKAILMGLGTTTTLGIIVFLIVYIFPEFIIGIFTSEIELIAISAYAVRRIFAAMYLTGIVLIGATMFQSLGKAFHAFVSTISRSVAFLLPLVLILPHFMGLEGVWWAFPANDLMASSLVIGMMIPVVRNLQRLKAADSAQSVRTPTD
jgi:putative MATE family efflux protein